MPPPNDTASPIHCHGYKVDTTESLTMLRVCRKELFQRRQQPASLGSGYGPLGRLGDIHSPHFHLDRNKNIVVKGNDIKLTAAATPVTCDDNPSSVGKPAGDCRFPASPSSERFTG